MMNCHLRKAAFRRSRRRRKASLSRQKSSRHRECNRPAIFELIVERLLIIDGHSYAYRAFHAIRELHSPSGKPTNAIYGFIKMLAKLRANVDPTHWIVVWDGGLSAERMAALPGYKAHRPEMPKDLESQLDEIIE